MALLALCSRIRLQSTGLYGSIKQIKCSFSCINRQTLNSRWSGNLLRSSIRSSKQKIQNFANSVEQNIPEKAQKYVGFWLLGCCGMVVGAVSLGGITRLTESGLSMTSWNLIRGMKPPRSQKEWEEEFEKYKNFPEYKYSRLGMTMNEFKFIFYMEYFHRMWGRAIGLTFFLPAIYFWKKGWVPKSLKPRLMIFGSLLLGQGLLGWYMVKSGLKEETMSMSTQAQPHVSQYRLAAHLAMAFTLYSGMLWQGLAHLMKPEKIAASSQLLRFKGLTHGTLALVFFTAISGAFVAGLDAGLVYNSFPKMADKWIPTDLWALTPWYKNIFENPTTTQFNHRVLGTSTVSAVIAVWCLARPLALPYRARIAVNCLLGMSLAQVSLGVATLLTYVPTSLAASHQLGSLSLLSIALWLQHELSQAKKILPK